MNCNRARRVVMFQVTICASLVGLTSPPHCPCTRAGKRAGWCPRAQGAGGIRQKSSRTAPPERLRIYEQGIGECAGLV